MKENLALARKLNIGATIISIVVLLLVLMMRRVKIDTGIDFSILPPLHAVLNTMAAISLAFAYYFIKNKRVEAHRKSIYFAFGFSILFLLSYVLYHFTTPETSYCFEGNIRKVYFFFLITHVILAAVILPFILFTLIRALTGQIERHRAMAKWVFPLWFYVAISGPIVYLMLSPCYG